MSVALKLQNCVDDMLQNLRSCDGAVLGDMTDQKHRHMECLGNLVHLRRSLTNLADASRSCLHRWRLECLNRVDNHDVGLHVLKMFQDILCVCLIENQAVIVFYTYSVGTHFYLLLALLARHIKYLFINAQCHL